jgi:hypothetical protein
MTDTEEYQELIKHNDRLDGLLLHYKELMEKRQAYIGNNMHLFQKMMPKVNDVFRITPVMRSTIFKKTLPGNGLTVETFDDSHFLMVIESKLSALKHGWGTGDPRFPLATCIVVDDTFKPVVSHTHKNGYEYNYTFQVPIHELLDKVGHDTSLKPTYIYLMIDKNTGLYKIGRSANPKKREETLQSEKPTIELMFHYRSFNICENYLHKHFHEKRIRGEWFELNSTDLEFIHEYFKKSDVERINLLKQVTNEE